MDYRGLSSVNMKRPIINDVTELIGRTPLLRFRHIVPDGSAEVLGKLELLNPGGSVKDRPCREMLEEAERKGLIGPRTTIIEPTTGNTGIGLAMICAVKGYKCILTMPEDLSLERIYMLRTYGAEVILTPVREGVPGAIRKARELHAKLKDSFMPLQFQSAANPQAHYKSTGPEIWEDCEGHVDAFVAGVGTGGTITGTGAFLKEKIPHIRIVAVEPAGCAVLSGQKTGPHKIQGIGAGFIPEILNQDLIDGVEIVTDEQAFGMARLLGRKEGVCVGISSGANVVAALRVAARLGPGKRVVTILCDTGERYFSTEQFFEA